MSNEARQQGITHNTQIDEGFLNIVKNFQTNKDIE